MMDYNKYLEKHSDKIFHYCIPTKPGTKVLVRNEWKANAADYLSAIVVGYFISEDAIDVKLYIGEHCLSSIRPVTDFGKSIFIGDALACERYDLHQQILNGDRFCGVFADKSGKVFTLKSILIKHEFEFKDIHYIFCSNQEEYNTLKELFSRHVMVSPAQPADNYPHSWYWDIYKLDWIDTADIILQVNDLKRIIEKLAEFGDN